MTSKRRHSIYFWGVSAAWVLSILVAIVSGVLYILPMFLNSDYAKQNINHILQEKFPQFEVTYDKIGYSIALPTFNLELTDVAVRQKSQLLVAIPAIELSINEEKIKMTAVNPQITLPLSAIQELADQLKEASPLSTTTGNLAEEQDKSIELLMRNAHWVMEDINITLEKATIHAQLDDDLWQFNMKGGDKENLIEAFAKGRLNSKEDITLQTKFKNFIPLNRLPFTWKDIEGTVFLTLNENNAIHFRGQGQLSQAAIPAVTVQQANWQAAGVIEPNVTVALTLNASARTINMPDYYMANTVNISANLYSGGHWSNWLSSMDGSYVVAVNSLEATVGAAVTASVYVQGDFLINKEVWQSQLTKIDWVNEDLQINAQSIINGVSDSVSQMTVQANVNYADLAQLHRYITAGGLHDYFVQSVLGGEITQGSINYVQNLTSTVLLLDADFDHATLAITDGWPVAENLSGNLVLDENSLRLKGKGAFVDAYADNVVALIDNIYDGSPTLNLNIDVRQGSIPDYFRTAKKVPPIAAAINRSMNFVQTRFGRAKITLAIDVPLSGDDLVQTKALVTVDDIIVRTDNRLPLLAVNTGQMSIHNKTFTGSVRGYLEDGNKHSVTVTFNRQGDINASGVIASSLALSLTGLKSTKVGGQMDFNLKIKPRLTVIIASLDDVNIDFPFPLNKKIASPAKLSVDLYEGGSQVAYSNQAVSINFYRSAAGVDIAINENNIIPPKSGGYLHGHLADLNIDEWVAVIKGDKSNDTPSATLIRELDLQLSNVNIFDIPIAQAAVQMTISSDNVYEINIKKSPVIEGQLKISDTLVKASLAHLHVPISLSNSATTTRQGVLNSVTVSVVIDDLNIFGFALGSLAISGQPKGENWSLNQFKIAQGVNTLSMVGHYHHQKNKSELSVMLSSENVPELLTIFDIEPPVSEGKANLQGNLAWNGELFHFSLLNLQGQLTLTGNDLYYENISFTSEMVNFLSNLSPQSLLKLGIKEVGKPGIKFESLNGTMVLKDGYVHLESTTLASDNVDIEIKGKTNILKKHHALHGRVRPGKELASAGSSATWALPFEPISFFAGIVLGKIFEKPIAEIGAYNYTITGAWDDPKYELTNDATPTESPHLQ